MNLPLAGVFILLGVLAFMLRRWGHLQHRKIYRLLPGFLMGNGIGFLLPFSLYWDGIIIGVILVGLDMYNVRKNNKKQLRLALVPKVLE